MANGDKAEADVVFCPLNQDFCADPGFGGSKQELLVCPQIFWGCTRFRYATKGASELIVCRHFLHYLLQKKPKQRRREEPLLYCPECNAPMVLRKDRRYGGGKTVCICRNALGHKDLCGHLYETTDGKPDCAKKHAI
ncbi:MAG: hypothetical protein IJS54_03855 [Desulfovibrio sp.]|nr:hypothetical protein [Desulfovibrio sp.]